MRKTSFNEEKKIQALAESLAAIYVKIAETEDEESALEVLQLYEKVKQMQLTIAFCGHFSAGKSSMINAIVQNNILPSSPIPTSANLVRLQEGSGGADIRVRDRGTIHLPPPIDMGQIKELCKNGLDVQEVTIHLEKNILPDKIAIFDTPGIDSTDDAHRVATESALHLGDVVFYVMDYNHVLSQLNFTFVRLLKEQGKKLYLIVNQIDKHNEKELDFKEFQTKVEAGFKSWGIEPEKIFYTSVLKPDHPYSQLKDIRTLIEKFYLEKDQTLIQSTINETKRLIQKHVQTLTSHFEDNFNEQFQLIEEERENSEDTRNEYERLLHDKETHEKRVEEEWADYKNEAKKIVENAILMPFHTRDLARNYIESRQNGFKIGFLFSSKKTEEERDKRLEALFKSVKENIETQIEWHLNDYLTAFCKTYDHPPFKEVTIPLTKDDLAKLIKPGASLNGEYVLQYGNDVANEIKRLAFKELQSILAEIENSIRAKGETKLAEVEQELVQLAQKIEAYETYESVKEQLEETEEELNRLLTAEHIPEAMIEETEAARARHNRSLDAREIENLMNPIIETELTEGTHNQQERQSSRFTKGELASTAARLKQVSDIIRSVSGLENSAADMERFAERIESREFTVSLFGAFSAGKSSFANALLGDDLLPVSPNPTTATINQIKPATNEIPHGTVFVVLKSEDSLLSEINQSLSHFGIQAENMKDAVKMAGSLSQLDGNEKTKPHIQFLRAVNSGFQKIENQLGKQLKVSIEQFKEFVATEEKACFADHITIYIDSPLTNLGVTLVDTPGADSINARHTNVAFEYIKNSDVILYVTYYNHAFSSADREFLIQLGRVKDAFELDKMFFLINAADLASDEEELNDVVLHVQQNLQQFGIRNPRLFPVSSRYAILGQKDRSQLTDDEKRRLQEWAGSAEQEQVLIQSGFTPFYNRFTTFIQDDLSNMLVSKAKRQVEQVKTILDHFIGQAALDKESREAKALHLDQQLNKGFEITKQLDQAEYNQRLEKEIKELLFYVKQRVFLRFNEFFNESFNPAVLTGTVKEQKMALPSCLKELHERLEFDLLQESRATMLRVENYISKLLKEILQELKNEFVKNELPESIFTEIDVTIQTPELSLNLEHLEASKSAALFKFFKNARQFFEENGKSKMMESAKDMFDEPCQRFILKSTEEFNRYYGSCFQTECETQLGEINERLSAYIKGLLLALNDPTALEQLRECQRKIESIE
ncbi:dynamin family protein [Fictibacillus gelatini]|uniref:dynamin family protein n=1 Tax=Fictibacillus gelatini TaxID=225985 RepID=UPI000420A2E0|nr:dynamin family protein [Fictibacillus gelatini]